MPRSSTGSADDLEPGRADRRPRVVERRVLDRDPRRAARRQRAAGQPQALRVAARDDELARGDAAHAHEVGGELGAQLRVAVRVAVVERRVGHRREHAPQRRRPRAARERGEVRRGRGEVEPRRGRARPAARRPRGAAAGTARTTGALPRRTSIQPSAAICAYASLTTPRETPSASASTRDAGRRVPAGAPPPVIAAQIASSSCARSGAAAARSSGAKSSKVARFIGIRVALSEGPPARYRARP